MLFAAASVAGLPPLPGFLGKLMVLQSAVDHATQAAVWIVVLGVGFLTLVGLARAGSILFWSVRPELAGTSASAGASPRLVAATLFLLMGTVAMTIQADALKAYTDAAAAQLGDRRGYAEAVLGPAAADGTGTTRTYRFPPPAAPTPEETPR
jgi:multicomponent K+:H+ antiporter subunit D